MKSHSPLGKYIQHLLQTYSEAYIQTWRQRFVLIIRPPPKIVILKKETIAQLKPVLSKCFTLHGLPTVFAFFFFEGMVLNKKALVPQIPRFAS
jgi:hypothetical protein